MSRITWILIAILSFLCISGLNVVQSLNDLGDGDDDDGFGTVVCEDNDGAKVLSELDRAKIDVAEHMNDIMEKEQKIASLSDELKQSRAVMKYNEEKAHQLLQQGRSTAAAKYSHRASHAARKVAYCDRSIKELSDALSLKLQKFELLKQDLRLKNIWKDAFDGLDADSKKKWKGWLTSCERAKSAGRTLTKYGLFSVIFGLVSCVLDVELPEVPLDPFSAFCSVFGGQCYAAEIIITNIPFGCCEILQMYADMEDDLEEAQCAPRFGLPYFNNVPNPNVNDPSCPSLGSRFCCQYYRSSNNPVRPGDSGDNLDRCNNCNDRMDRFYRDLDVKNRTNLPIGSVPSVDSCMEAYSFDGEPPQKFDASNNMDGDNANNMNDAASSFGFVSFWTLICCFSIMIASMISNTN